MLVTTEKGEVQQAKAIERLEAHLLDLPQVECPVVHHFGPGIYVREVTLPAGALAIGHAQRFEHLNVMLKGKVALLDDSGHPKVLEAPLIFTGKPGRKIGYIIEETVWQNIYATEERDIDKLEATFLDKSESWQLQEAQSKQIEHLSREIDREDFLAVIAEAGFTVEQVRAQSENLSDQISISNDLAPKVTIRDSAIEGKGVFLSSPAEPHEYISPARIAGKRTPAGRYTNHSKNPNAYFTKTSNGDIFLVAARRIAGCQGGSKGEEVTVDYRQALTLSGIQLKGETA